jgi:hypothetical protein
VGAIGFLPLPFETNVNWGITQPCSLPPQNSLARDNDALAGSRSQTFQTRGLNRNRQPLLKEVFKGAAHLVATQMTDHPLHQDYQRLIDGGMRPNLASSREKGDQLGYE